MDYISKVHNSNFSGKNTNQQKINSGKAQQKQK